LKSVVILILKIPLGEPMLLISLFSLLFFTIPTANSQDIEITPELIDRLRDTYPVNLTEILTQLNLTRYRYKSPSEFLLANPFFPTTKKKLDSRDKLLTINGIQNYKDRRKNTVEFFQQSIIHEWSNRTPAKIRESEVCGVRFLDERKRAYEMRSFFSREEAEVTGFFVTHQYHCGACSNLKDLSVYLEKRDLAEPGRKCAAQLTLRKSKKCYQEEIGFSEACSEVWAYNAKNTKKVCLNTCIKEYGLINILKKQFPNEYVNTDGTLKDCILCDELNSVPGYRYCSGLTRRGAGIEAAIAREPGEMYYIDYRKYYTLFELEQPEI
jgi:hypothetical protein